MDERCKDERREEVVGDERREEERRGEGRLDGEMFDTFEDI